MSLTEWAYQVSQENLEGELPRRWSHVQGVARKAAALAAAMGSDAPLLEASAVLHDVGYAPSLAHTGFHPLDGAVYLASIGAPERLVSLVAHHSCAAVEAEMRGLGNELAAFRDESSVVSDALWYCDLTTTPDGEPISFQERVAEIKLRYGPGHLVTRFIDAAEPSLREAVTRTELLIKAPSAEVWG